ncbi:MAG TPA: N-acetylmuramoyl-L-alanine amidase [Candidatus Sulfotelmatobacter sp.]|nr:N-acetylmuramoyl-L-alanine amidase [Candidatus Sulfotelmatobacter sp.]
MKTLSSQRSLRWGALLLVALLSGMPAHARVHHTEAWAHDRFATAERMREALNGRPSADLARRDYQRVINAYRSVYFGAPTSTKADPSVVAVAETLVEMGRRFDDAKILNGAIAQYKFLRHEYPGSKYRCDALFTIGEIYKDDLGQPDQARATFQDFLHRYPHNRLVEDAQQAIAELDQQAQAAKKAERENSKSDKRDSAAKGASGAAAAKAESGAAGKPAGEGAAGSQSSPAQASEHLSPERLSVESSTGARPNAKLPRVTGIRHWSTPDYTRVAIDLEDQVDFASQRIAHPDRIFFDLRNTKLASTLVGKSFDVDDGFLKKIRVAQFQPGRTRVVLEVADLSRYNAFLLPNPYRLIIDIHGKDIHAKDRHAKDGQGKDGQGKNSLTRNAGGQQPTDSNEMALAPDVEADPTAGSKPDQSLASSDPLGTKPNQAAGSTRVVRKIVEADDDGNDGDQKTAADEVATAPTTKSKPPRSTSHSAGGPAVRTGDDDASYTSSDSSIAAADDNAAPAPKSKRSSRAGEESKTLDGRTPDGKTPDRKTRASLDIHEARPTAHGDRSLIRALGLKIGKIVIDPGHGGHDTGTIGPDGLEEKDLVLEVGRRLGKMLETRLGAEVVYTRKDDTFIPLETRTAIANQERADLFISIHANSSHDPAARGVETYYLNFTSSPEALEVAARENAVSEKSIYELRDLVKKIALKDKIEESREFAGDVQASLHSGLAAKSPAIRDRGVKKAPFIVLIGANMPSILAEISFVSNPTDEHRLETAEYRQRIADSLYRGVAKYVSGLSGVKVASKLDKPAGQ